MTYIDVMVAAVSTDRKAEYLEHAKVTGDIFRKHGVISIAEGWGDDVPDGKLTSFPLAVKLEPGETVAVLWMVWPSKAERDKGMAAIMDDPGMTGMDMPFDGKRMIYGGFESLL